MENSDDPNIISFPARKGELRFNFANNDGRLIIGEGDGVFQTQWSSAGQDSIHIYNDPPSIEGVAIVEGVSTISEIGSQHIEGADFSSRTRTAKVGQFILLKSVREDYAAIHVLSIEKSDKPSRNLLHFRFAITAVAERDFASYTDDTFDFGEVADLTLPPITGEMAAKESIESSRWTGQLNVQQQARLVKSIAPSMVEAIELLIGDWERQGHNGGPPLDERKNAIETLKQLHNALGHLIDCASAEAIPDHFPGAIQETMRWADRFKESVKGDPIPLALAVVIASVCTSFGAPVVASVGVAAALSYGRKK